LLKEILKRLKEGKGIVLSTVLNQAREEIPDEVLYYSRGKWILRRINCRSSADLGLGVCQCTSHPSTVKEEITWEEAVKLIAEYYQREKRKEEEREESRKKFELLLELFSKLEEEPLEKIEVLHKLFLL
jgi:ABC-type multidrug transport system ATPase subunit